MYSRVVINLKNLPKIDKNKIISKELYELYNLKNKSNKTVIIKKNNNNNNNIQHHTSPW